MGGKDFDSKDMVQAAQANLLDHSLSATPKRYEKVMEIKISLDDMDKTVEKRTAIYLQLRKLIGLLSGNAQAREYLESAVSELHKLYDLYRRINPERLRRVIFNLNDAIEFAIGATFGQKDDIENLAMITIISKTGIVRTSSLVPESVAKMMDDIEKGDND
jgi:hypothetical protein